MPLHIRFEGDIDVLSYVGRSMNDPCYTDARGRGGVLNRHPRA
jgi:hypothetical protein